MKKTILFSLLCSLAISSYSQTILNGSFETNTASGDMMDMYPGTHSATISNSNGVDGGYMDLITSNSFCGAAQDGAWYLQNNLSEYYGAFSLEFSAELVPGNLYELSFFARACSVGGDFDIGLSYYDSLAPASYLATRTCTSATWLQFNEVFVAPDSARNLIINIPNSGMNKRIQFDNFVLSIPSALNDGSENHFPVTCYPNPAYGETFLSVASEWNGSELVLRNLNGQEMRRANLTGEQTRVDLNDIPAGMYFYSVESVNGISDTGKLIVK